MSTALCLGILIISVGGQEQNARNLVAEGGRPDRIPDRDFVNSDTVAELCLVPAVAEELHLSPEQRETLLGAYLHSSRLHRLDHLHRELRNAAAHLQDASRSGDQVLMLDYSGRLATTKAQLAHALTQRDSQVTSHLTEEQTRRLYEILLGRLGIRAVARADIADSLKLLDTQRDQIRVILHGRDREFQNLRERSLAWSLVSGYAEERKRILDKVDRKEELTKEELHFLRRRASDGVLPTQDDIDQYEARVDQELWRILTPAQRRRFERLKGEPFDIRLLTRDAQPMPTELPQPKPPEADPPK